MLTYRNLHELLYAEFPGLGLSCGPGARRPRDQRRFRADLERLATRLRRRNRIVTAMIVAWFAVLITVAVLSHEPVRSVSAIGAMGAGTPWCIREMRAIHRELFAIELLLRALASPEADLGQLGQLCIDILGGAGLRDRAAGAARKPARTTA
jgi:hypothetical protein